MPDAGAGPGLAVGPAEPAGAATLDLLYPSGFYSFQTPLLLDYVAALNGRASPADEADPERAFSYCDLGCGDGLTLILLAAIYPHCRFIGVDLNPGHIARGQALIAAAGLHNVRLIEGAFADWRSFGLPSFDYVALHGVYAWISEEDRRAVQALLTELLSRRALVYLGYNAWPGWAAIAPMRQMLLGLSAGKAAGEDLAQGVRAALKQLQRLKERGADYFNQNPVAGRVLDDMLGRNIRYVAHEIHSPHWSPLPFSRVADDMGLAGLTYVGSADLARNFSAFSVPSAFQRMLDDAPAGTARETLRDCIVNTFFRRDVFGRSPADGNAARDASARLALQPFGAKIHPSDMTTTIPSPSGPLTLAGEPFATLRRILGEGTATLAALQQSLPRLTQEQLVRLTLGFQVAPFLCHSRLPELPASAWKITLALNRLLMSVPATEDPFVIVISPVAGNGIPVAFADALVILAVDAAGPEDASTWAERQPEALRNRLKLDGKLIRDPVRYAAAFENYHASIADTRLRKLEELGVIERR